MLLFVNLAARPNVQNRDCCFGFCEQNPKTRNAKAFCSAAGQLDHIVRQRRRIDCVLVDFCRICFARLL
jgi:hypothetical protein